MHCSRSRPSSPVTRQHGAALIFAMLVFALATALVVAMKGEFERFYQRSSNILLDGQAQAYLRGAEDLAGILLLADYDMDKNAGLLRDDLTEIWWTKPGDPPPTYALDGTGWLSGSLEDLQGRFNLNTLVEKASRDSTAVSKKRFTASQEQFIRLLQALGDPAVSEQEAIILTESVTDWLDADREASLNGAEDDYYSGQTPAYRTANRSMSSVSELRAVAYMTPEIYQALLPWVTVWPEQPATLNIHTAPAMVLRSINAKGVLSPLTEAEGESLVQYREETGFEDKTDFQANPVFEGKRDNMKEVAALLGQNSTYFLLRAEVEVAGRNMRLYSVLNRSNRTIAAVARASGSL
ncbi:MAG: type II secretion system minor pseudopilin GspK [Halioglobus sp.]